MLDKLSLILITAILVIFILHVNHYFGMGLVAGFLLGVLCE